MKFIINEKNHIRNFSMIYFVIYFHSMLQTVLLNHAMSPFWIIARNEIYFVISNYRSCWEFTGWDFRLSETKVDSHLSIMFPPRLLFLLPNEIIPFFTQFTLPETEMYCGFYSNIIFLVLDPTFLFTIHSSRENVCWSLLSGVLSVIYEINWKSYFSRFICC